MNKEVMAKPMAPGLQIGTAIADLVEAVSDLPCDPRAIVKIAIEKVPRNYPTLKKEAAAAAVLLSFQPRIEEAMMNSDVRALRQTFGELLERLRHLTIPDRVPNFQDDFRECVHYFLNSSWSINEAEAVRYFSRHGDRIGKITPSTVQLGDRIILRAECREALAKRGWQAARLAQLAEIERRRIAVDAENLEREKRGESPIVYTGQVGGMTRY